MKRGPDGAGVGDVVGPRRGVVLQRGWKATPNKPLFVKFLHERADVEGRSRRPRRWRPPGSGQLSRRRTACLVPLNGLADVHGPDQFVARREKVIEMSGAAADAEPAGTMTTGTEHYEDWCRLGRNGSEYCGHRHLLGRIGRRGPLRPTLVAMERKVLGSAVIGTVVRVDGLLPRGRLLWIGGCLDEVRSLVAGRTRRRQHGSGAVRIDIEREPGAMPRSEGGGAPRFLYASFPVGVRAAVRVAGLERLLSSEPGGESIRRGPGRVEVPLEAPGARVHTEEGRRACGPGVRALGADTPADLIL